MNILVSGDGSACACVICGEATPIDHRSMRAAFESMGPFIRKHTDCVATPAPADALAMASIALSHGPKARA